MNVPIEDAAYQASMGGRTLDIPSFMEKRSYDPTTSYHLSDEVYHAVSSDIAYKHRKHIQKDPATANMKTEKLIKSRMEGHDLMGAYSNENQVVIRRPDDSIIFAVRGTDPSNPSDIVNDAYITFAAMDVMPESRLKEVEKVFKKLPKDKKVTLTGHSLGADIARRIGEKYNKRSVTFSTPAVYASFPGSSKNTTFLTNTFDIVSTGNIAFNFRDTLQFLPQTSKNLLTGSHDISNFLPPETMYPLKHYAVPNPKSVEFPIKHISKSTFSFRQDITPPENPFIPTSTFDYGKYRKKKSKDKDKNGDLE
jgi:hypothetical protein